MCCSASHDESCMHAARLISTRPHDPFSNVTCLTLPVTPALVIQQSHSHATAPHSLCCGNGRVSTTAAVHVGTHCTKCISAVQLQTGGTQCSPRGQYTVPPYTGGTLLLGKELVLYSGVQDGPAHSHMRLTQDMIDQRVAKHAAGPTAAAPGILNTQQTTSTHHNCLEAAVQGHQRGNRSTTQAATALTKQHCSLQANPQGAAASKLHAMPCKRNSIKTLQAVA